VLQHRRPNRIYIYMTLRLLCLPLNSNLNSLSPLYLGTLQQLIFTTKRMVTHKIRNRSTRSAGPRYDDWSGSAGRGGNSGGDGDGTGAFSAQQAPRPDGLLVDSVGAFSSPMNVPCVALSRSDEQTNLLRRPPPKTPFKNIDF